MKIDEKPLLLTLLSSCILAAFIVLVTDKHMGWLIFWLFLAVLR